MEISERIVPPNKTPRSIDSPASDTGVSPTRPVGRRTKRWAPRATTGCLTCRLRHVKCDEFRPECGRCLKRGVKCHFDRNPAVVQVALDSPSSRDANSFIMPIPVALGGLTPLQYDWIASCRIFGIILSAFPVDPLFPAEDLEAKRKALWVPDHTMESRIRFVLGHYFTQQRRSSPPPTRDGWLGDLASVQRKFSHYTGQVLAKLGTDIGDPRKYLEKQVLSRVSLLIATDISVGTPTLRHHLRGFIAGVKATGGIRVALDNHEIHRNSVFLVMMSMIITNTTSPSFDQMGEEAFFTNEDVYAYCADELMETFPCPTQLFLCIRDINRARREIAGGQYSTGIVREMMQAIFRIIASFEPQTWRERYVLPEPEVRFQLAAMYKAATMLYGMMTLAAYAGVPFDASHRIASTEGIVDLALALSQPLGDHLALAWPLMVAGASLGGAPPGRQAVVDRLLLSISQGVYASNGVFFALERLRVFWKSGKTEWDECFSTWQAAIP